MKKNREVYIVAAKRTAIGGYLGSLASLSAIELGSKTAAAVIKSSGIDPNTIDEVILGNVLSANLGQSPARQVAKQAMVPDSADATTINKVCSSGLKSIAYAAQSIMSYQSELVLAGGMESMSNTPYYLEQHRTGNKMGNQPLVDGMLKDGLWDPYHDFHMGNAAEMANKKYQLSREDQDSFALSSFAKAAAAHNEGRFKEEIVPIEVQGRKSSFLYTEDEDIKKLNPEKIGQLKPIFEPKGSITAANASNLNDGAAILLVASEGYIRKHGLKPLAKIVSFADAAQAPEWFSSSPTLAIKKALALTNVSLTDIDCFEINEAYANVTLLNAQLLGIDIAKVNMNGGAVAMGHPLGASGARIMVSLIHVLKQQKARYGMAAICNGGGGASAMLIEALDA